MVQNQNKRSRKAAEHVMMSTISFIQANLQHSITASGVLCRTLAVKGIDMVLIQEPWYCEGHIMGLNIPGYTLFSMSGIDRPRASILTKNMNIWMLPGFSCRYLVVFPINYNDGDVERHLVVCSVYLPYDSEDPPLSREFEELVLL